MTESDYKKYIAPQDRDWESKEVLIRTAIVNARKNAAKKTRLSGYRKLRKAQLVKVVRKQLSNNH